MHFQAQGDFIQKNFKIKNLILAFVTTANCQIVLFQILEHWMLGNVIFAPKVTLMPPFLQLHRILQIETSFNIFFLLQNVAATTAIVYLILQS